MLPNVWSEKEFKDASSKVFSTGRSPQLRAIDDALRKAHTFNPDTELGVNAIIDLLQAIAEWRKFKQTQGKLSGRASAVDTLQGQLASAAEAIYRRKIGALEKPMSPAQAKQVVQQTFSRLASAPQPPKPVTPKFVAPAAPLPALAKRTAAEDRLFDHLAQAMLNRRKQAMGFDDADLFEDCDAQQKGRLAAKWMLSVPDAVTDVAAARAEALRVIGAMLGNDVSVVKSLFEKNFEVVVVSRNQGMTTLRQFSDWAGKRTEDGRSWDVVRGMGEVKAKSTVSLIHERKELRLLKESGRGPASVVAIDPLKGRIYTAITEENLLGGVVSVPDAGCYAQGYSTTTHEFAHAIHAHGLTGADRSVIDKAYKLRLLQGEGQIWVDGPRKVGTKVCYAATTVREYFAQLVNAWLGANIGSDPYTMRPRNNGRQWVIDNEPRPIVELIERVFGQRALEDLNPAVLLKS